MNKSEILKIFEMLKNTYPEFQKLIKDKENTKNTLEIWHSCLKDLTYSDIELAIYELIKISKYIPTIAEIREKVQQMRKERENKEIQYKAVDTSTLSQEVYGRLMRKETTIEKLIEEGKVHV